MVKWVDAEDVDRYPAEIGTSVSHSFSRSVDATRSRPYRKLLQLPIMAPLPKGSQGVAWARQLPVAVQRSQMHSPLQGRPLQLGLHIDKRRGAAVRNAPFSTGRPRRVVEEQACRSVHAGQETVTMHSTEQALCRRVLA
jgi:hypothetical protein